MFTTGIQETEEHRKYMKQIIDDLADQTVSQLSKLRTECIDSFTKFKAESNRSLKKLEELMKSNRQVTKSDSNVLIVDTAKELADMKLDIPKFGNLPEFKLALGSRSDADRLLKRAFGCITDTTRIPDQQHRNHDLRFRQLLGDPVLINTRQLLFIPRSIAVTRDGNVWLHPYGSTSLHYIDQRNTHDKLEINEYVHDISVHTHTDILYCLLDNQRIVTVDRKTANFTELFVAECNNRCLAVITDGNILLGNYYKPMVTLYTDIGRKLKTFTYKGTNPAHISVCMSTGMVALACYGSDVLVLDSGLKEIHRYMGPIDLGQSSELNTRDTVFDHHGHLIILEYERQHVNILNAATGEHLQTITLDKMGYGKCLTLNKEGDIVVGTEDSNLLKFKYVQ